VNAALARRGEACLVRSMVRQSWLTAHGNPRDLIIGVTGPSTGFQAHAWLEGDPQPGQPAFTELTRRAPS
jgi:hypothetical protein